MSKKDEFKEFVKSKPDLINYVKSGKGSWQDLYEVYDLYGEEDSAWDKYLEDDQRVGLAELSKAVKNINIDNIQKHINNAQKILGVIEELTVKKPGVIENIPTSVKPINKFFGD